VRTTCEVFSILGPPEGDHRNPQCGKGKHVNLDFRRALLTNLSLASDIYRLPLAIIMSNISMFPPSLDEVNAQRTVEWAHEALHEMRQDFEEEAAEFSEDPSSHDPFCFAEPDDETAVSKRSLCTGRSGVTGLTLRRTLRN
jgi:hypothetical protein